jgi:hypothetical protein
LWSGFRRQYYVLRVRSGSLSPRDINRYRLVGQFLVGPRLTAPVDVVRTLGAVQAQDYAGARWAIGQRLVAATDSAIDEVTDSGQLLRTHVLRPTWHLVAPEDIRWMLKLTAPRVKSSMAAYHRALGFDEKTCGRGQEIIRKALEGGNALTRSELGAVLKRARFRHCSLQPLGHLLMRAELDAVVCSGPRRGKQSTYALLDERAAGTPDKDRDESIAELALRFFSTRGPASVQDFGWWSGLAAADARRGAELLPKEFSAATFNDTKMWFLERKLPRMAPVAHLLPNYDEYFIGFKDRSAIGGRVRSVKLAGWQNAAFFGHLAFVNGDLVGGWKRVQERKTTVMVFTMVAKLAASERKLVERAVAKYAAFLGHQLEIRWK